jgi:hypothetical protein
MQYCQKLRSMGTNTRCSLMYKNYVLITVYSQLVAILILACNCVMISLSLPLI